MATYTIIPELADVLARRLREFGYPDVTPAMVQEQLHKPPEDRDIIGMFAAGICESNGILPDEDEAQRIAEVFDEARAEMDQGL